MQATPIKNTVKNTHPKGTYGLFGLQLLGMIGFSLIFSLIVLYCTNQLGMGDKHAYALVAAFNALAFVTSIPASMLAEKYLGYRYGMLLSIACSGLGLALIAFGTTFALKLGLGFFIMGTGMNVPYLYVLLGNLYDGNDHPLRENGFVLSYIGMNIGSFIASSCSGTLATHLGYATTFVIGAITTLLMIPLFYSQTKYFKQEFFSINDKVRGTLFVILLSLGTCELLNFANFSNALMLVFGLLCATYIIYIAKKQDTLSRNRILVFALLTGLSIVFWALYSLAPSLLTIFTERNVHRELFNTVIPAADFSALNPLVIISMGPLTTVFWAYLKRKKGIDISVAAKFGIGTVLMGLGYLVLVAGVHAHALAAKTNMSWLVLSYFFQTLGELFVGPIGYAMVGALVPAKLEGIMMGVWQLSAGIAGALSEYLANFAKTQGAHQSLALSNQHFSHAFFIFGAVTLATGLFTLLLTPKLNRACKPKQNDVQSEPKLATQPA